MLLAACSVFLPYVLTGAVILFLSVLILIHPHRRRMIFSHPGAPALIPFFALALILPLIYRNWLGLAGGAGLVLILIVGLYLRSVMTRALFERVLTILCVLSVTSFLIACVEMIVALCLHNPAYRCSAVFMNPNYYGTVVASIVVICAYKVLTRQGPQWVYYVIAAVNFLSVYLCGSLFAWVEIFVGVAALLIALRKHQMLVLFLLMAAAACVLLFFMPQLIPRLSESESTFELRLRIWKTSLTEIARSPWFGRGLMTYHQIYPLYEGSWATYHAHNILLDLLLNFGIIGAIPFLYYLARCGVTLARQYRRLRKTLVTSLIFALSAAALVHGLTDVTLIWLQTGLLFSLILSGLGVAENAERMRRINLRG